MGINVSAPTGSNLTKYPFQKLAKHAKTKTHTPRYSSLLNRCWSYIKSPKAMLSIGLILLLTKADSAEAKSLENRKVDLSLPDNLINHTLPDQKGNANGLRDNTNQQADTGRPFQPPPLPAFKYTDAQISDWIDYDEPQPLLETAVEGVESGAIMRDLFNKIEHAQTPDLPSIKTDTGDKNHTEDGLAGHTRTKRFTGELIPEESGTDEFLVKVFSSDFYCSGSILSRRKIITAAHCTEKKGKTVPLKISYNVNNYSVKNVRRCPNYDLGGKKKSMNDIALLSLSSPLPRSALRLNINLNFNMENEQTYRGRVNNTRDGVASIEDCFDLVSNSDNPPEARFPEFFGIGLGGYGDSCELYSNFPRKGFYQRSYKYAGHSNHDTSYCQQTNLRDNAYADFSDCMSQYSCYFNAIFNRFRIDNKNGGKNRTCPGDSGSPLLAFNKQSRQFDLIGVLSGNGTYSHLYSHKQWFLENFNTTRPNILKVYDSGSDRNLNIPVQSGIWPVPNTTLQQELNITLKNDLSTGPWFWRSQWSKLTLDLSFTTPIRNKPIRKKCLKFG